MQIRSFSEECWLKASDSSEKLQLTVWHWGTQTLPGICRKGLCVQHRTRMEIHNDGDESSGTNRIMYCALCWGRKWNILSAFWKNFYWKKKINKNLWHLMGQTLFTYIKYGFILKIPPNLSVFHWILFENKLLGLQKYKGPDALYEFKFHDLQWLTLGNSVSLRLCSCL